MGGREAVRGFAIQTLICLLDSLRPENDNWTAVTIEPDSANDKVDILWEFDRGNRVQQVKSSKNQIALGDVVRWCKELKASGKADSYQLMLAGPIAAAVLKQSPFDGVEVPIPNSMDVLALTEQAITKLDRYLASKSLSQIPLAVRESIISIISTKLLEGAIHAARLTRGEFDGWLIQWIVVAYPAAIEQRLATNCEILWSGLELVRSQTSRNEAFDLILPLTVVNSALSAAIVEWFVIRVSSENRKMLYWPLSQIPDSGEPVTGRMERSMPFGQFAVLPQFSVHQSVLFGPVARAGYAADKWPTGEYELELFVKYSSMSVPILVRKRKIDILIDHYSVLISDKTSRISLCDAVSFFDIL